MRCEKARRLINPMLDGDLDEQHRRDMEAHVASCPACRSELEGLRRSVRLLETLPVLSPPPGLASRVMARVLERNRAAAMAGSSPWGWIAAAILAGVGALLLYGYLGEVGLPWEPSTLEAVQPIGLDSLASLMASLEVGVVVAATLLFAGMAGLLVPLMGAEQRCQHG